MKIELTKKQADYLYGALFYYLEMASHGYDDCSCGLKKGRERTALEKIQNQLKQKTGEKE